MIEGMFELWTDDISADMASSYDFTPQSKRDHIPVYIFNSLQIIRYIIPLKLCRD